MGTDTLIGLVDKFGYWGIALLVAIENIFPPIPSEVILTFGGFMTTHSEMTVPGVIISSTIGAVAGAVILYLIGLIFNAERLSRLFASRLGRALHLESGDVSKAGRWFKRHGAKTVFFCRFIPIIRSLISIPAGSARMSLKLFLPLTLAGSAIWNTVLILLGRLAGDTWQKIAAYVDTYAMVAGAVLIIAIVFVVIKFVKKRFVQFTDIPDETDEPEKPGETDGKE
ncbi:alkaline phosphatase-like protein [Clostridia bacterium]|nr:alkaline phosphatase-like protein [Clostridia bacterium]